MIDETHATKTELSLSGRVDKCEVENHGQVWRKRQRKRYTDLDRDRDRGRVRDTERERERDSEIEKLRNNDDGGGMALLRA